LLRHYIEEHPNSKPEVVRALKLFIAELEQKK
jgi:hypothetical protein